MATTIPRFEPHPLLRNRHSQTVVGRYLPAGKPCPPFEAREIAVSEGDRLLVFDSIPEGWSPGRPVAMVVHGLAGCAGSPYVIRLTAKLYERGIRVVRVNLRGAGVGFGLAKGIYHGGRTEDLRSVTNYIAQTAQGSQIGLVGFSLGAALVLKLAAEAAIDPLEGLDCVVAANPPLDLAACARNMRRRGRKFYDRNFVKSLRAEIGRLHEKFPELGATRLEGVTSVYEFDDAYTAPRNGFRDADDYYTQSSAGPFVGRITVPGLVVHARDDPFIPVETVASVRFPSCVALEMISSGGHLGFVSKSTWDGDHRWLESRLTAWLVDHWADRLNPHSTTTSARKGGHFAHERRPAQQ